MKEYPREEQKTLELYYKSKDASVDSKLFA